VYLQPLLRNLSRKLPNSAEITQPLGLLRCSRSFKVTDFGTNRKLICDFLLVINTNLAPIFHRFRDMPRKGPKSLYLATPLWFNPLPPPEGFACYDLRKIFHQKVTDGQGTKWRRNIAENFNSLSRVHERYRQTTDRQTDRETTDGTSQRHIANVNVSSRLLKSIEDLLFMQFRRQGTKIFIKLELRRIHIFILQYSFIQLLLVYQRTIHMYSSTDRLLRIYASEQKRYIR